MIYTSTQNSKLLWSWEQLSDVDSCEIDCSGKSQVDLLLEVSSVSGFAIGGFQLTVEGVANGVRSAIPAGHISTGGDCLYSVSSNPTWPALTVYVAAAPTTCLASMTVIHPPPVIRLTPNMSTFPVATGTGSYFKAALSWR